jgi:hypothetical protein
VESLIDGAGLLQPPVAVEDGIPDQQRLGVLAVLASAALSIAAIVGWSGCSSGRGQAA